MGKKSVVLVGMIILAMFLLTIIGNYTGYSVFESGQDAFKKPDVKISIPSEFKRINPGDEIEVTVIYTDFEVPQEINATHSLKRINGNVVTSKTESLYLQEETLFRKKISLPDDLESGAYVYSVRIEDSNSLSSDFFEVERELIPKKISINTLMIIIGVLILAAIAIIIKLNWPIVNRFNRIRINLFFWNLKWRLKEHKYYIIPLLIILVLLLIILVLLILS